MLAADDLARQLTDLELLALLLAAMIHDLGHPGKWGVGDERGWGVGVGMGLLALLLATMTHDLGQPGGWCGWVGGRGLSVGGVRVGGDETTG